MRDEAPKILLVEPDAGLLEMLVSSLSGGLDAHLTCVSDAESCIDVVLSETHDLILVDLSVPDAEGADIVHAVRTFTDRPLVLLADNPDCDAVLEMIRIGADDVLLKPFAMTRLLEQARDLVAQDRLQRRRASRNHRMRGLVRRVIRERRELNKRVELVCRDLVGAHRRLVDRIVSVEDNQPRTASNG